ASAPPPLLALSRTGGGLQLSLSGGVGQSYEVQQVSALAQTNWTTVVSLTLTNNPQIVALPSPADSPVFWRVAAP
ncbi:MAG: hypothetical protein KGS61_15445, partial [Verrucomicrobia bacterium]|nr:hypothetical protein [Verrucomicrobiota bacterium]